MGEALGMIETRGLVAMIDEVLKQNSGIVFRQMTCQSRGAF